MAIPSGIAAPVSYEPGGGTPRVNAEPSPPFILVFSPIESWDVESSGLAGPTLLPRFRRLAIAPGANGIKQLRPSEADQPERAYRDALAGLIAAGDVPMPWYEDRWKITDPTHAPANVTLDRGHYHRAVPVVHKGQTGIRYVEAWEVPGRALGNRPVPWLFDRASFNRWRASLVVKGLIPEPDGLVVEEMIATVNKRRDRALVLDQSPELKAALLKRAEERIEAVESAALPTAESLATPPAKAITARARKGAE